MKTTLATLTLCLVALMATGFPLERKGGSSPGGAAKEKRVQYAAWDDVNVIAHGLLQLGQGLKEHVDKTKLQMRDISTKLKVYNRTVTELGKESQKLRMEGESLKARVHGLEDREGQLLNVTAELREKAEEMQQERRTMSERMSRLEERVDSMLQGDALLLDTNAGAKNNSDARNIQVRMHEFLSLAVDDYLFGKSEGSKLRRKMKLNEALQCLQNMTHLLQDIIKKYKMLFYCRWFKGLKSSYSMHGLLAFMVVFFPV